MSIDGGRVCLFKCNREVTVYVDIKAVAVCLYRVTEVKCTCSCKPSLSLLRSLVWSYCVRVE